MDEEPIEVGKILDFAAKRHTDGPPPKPRPEAFGLTWFEDIKQNTDALDFIQGVLVEQSAAVIYGESNAGKTFWATDMALHVAAGKEWNGRRVDGGPVIYCALEGGIGFQNRVSAWRDHHGMEDATIPFASIQASLNLLDPEADTPRLVETLSQVSSERGQPKLVVIDTLSRALAGGNENSPEDMGALVKNMDAIRHAIGCCVLFIHHSGKDAAKGARGHSLLRAAIDTEIEVCVQEDSDVKQATMVKQRELKKGDVFAFTLTVVELGENRHGEAVTTCVVEMAEVPEKEPSNKPKSHSLSGDAREAFEILQDLLLEVGRPGMVGVANGAMSVTETEFRQKYYQRAKPGMAQDTKKKAFARAVAQLSNRKAIASNAGRIWIAW